MLVGASGTVVLQGASLGLGFATSVLLARVLGAGGYGHYVFALAWAGLLATAALLGLDRFLVRGIAVYRVHEKWELMRGLLERTNQIVLLTSTAIGIGGCVVAVLFLPSSLRWPFCLAMVFVPVSGITLLRQGAMQAMNRIVSGQVPEYLIRPVVILSAVGTLALAGRASLTPAVAVGVNVGAMGVACALGAVLLRRSLPPALASARPRYAVREWMASSLPMMLISGVWAANNYVGTLVVGTLDGPRAAGIYNVVEKGAGLILVFLTAANMPLAPAVARLYAQKDRHGLEHATERIARATLVVSTPIAAAFAIFPGVYLGLFGSGFGAGATALTILALGQLFNAAAGPAGNVLMMTGHERTAVRGIAAGLLVNLTLAVALVPPLGITGGAAAAATSLVLWNTILIVLARRRVGVNVTAFKSLSVT